MLYPGTLPPDPLDTALLEDEDVRFPETKFKFFFKSIKIHLSPHPPLLVPQPSS